MALHRKTVKQVFTHKTAPLAEYHREFNRECLVSYPEIDALERRLRYALDARWLLAAARDLACPVKRTPAHWAHGRVVYAVARSYFQGRRHDPMGFTVLDIGTAKGFSALCLAKALVDSEVYGLIYSLDIIDPMSRVARNTRAEIGGLKTVPELVFPFAPSRGEVKANGNLCFTIDDDEDGALAHIDFLGMGSQEFLQVTPPDRRFNLAFVDGKHDYAHVREESLMLAQNQIKGDVLIFDDLQFPGVRDAVARLQGYEVETLKPLPNRHYAIARKL